MGKHKDKDTMKKNLSKAARDFDDYASPLFKKIIFENPNNVKLLIAERADNKVIGIAGLSQSSFLGGLSLFIIIREEFHGKGIGNKLMKSLIAEAREKQCKYITLTTDKENSIAIHLFKKCGFLKYGEDTNNYFMVLYLSQLGKILFPAYRYLTSLVSKLKRFLLGRRRKVG